MLPGSDRLTTLKQIADYLEVTPRTVHRWEKSEGLPIHRHEHQKASTVYAFKSELDSWKTSRKRVTVPAPIEPAAVIEAPPAATPALSRQTMVAAAAAGLFLMAVVAVIVWPRPVAGTTLRTAPLTTLVGNEVTPSFSPDSQRIAFAWKGPGQDHYSIFIKDTGAGTAFRLTSGPADDVTPVWSPDSRRIAYLRRTSTMEAEVWVTHLDGSGQRRLATTNFPAATATWIYGSYLAYSPDGKWIVAPGAPGDYGLSAVAADGSEQRSLVAAPPGVALFAPAISADGRLLAFAGNSEAFSSDLWVTRLNPGFAATGPPSRLTSWNRWTQGPAFMPGTHRIVFTSGNLGSGRRFWAMEAEPGAAPVPFQVHADDGYGMAGAPRAGGGMRLAYVKGMLQTTIMKKEGDSQPEPFAPSTRVDGSPDYSPDGRRVAFDSNRSGNDEIWLCNADGSNPAQLTSLGAEMAGQPRWSPDGRTIVFHARVNGNFDLYAVSADGGVPTRLTDHAAADWVPNWSRDGRWIYFRSERAGPSRVWKIPAHGGDAIPVAEGGFQARESPDGKTLYYSKASDGTLWKMPAAGGMVEQVAAGLSRPRNFAFGPQGLYFTRQGWLELMPSNGAKAVRLLALGRPEWEGLAVSPNGKSILYTGIERQDTDLVLVEVPQ